MTSDEYEDILYENRILRWSARILGTIEVLLLFYMTFNEFREELANHSISPLLTLINGQYFLSVTLTIVWIGLIIAYWKEGIGGGISLVTIIVLFFGWNDYHLNFIIGMGMFSIPSVLYVVYWMRVYMAVKRANRDQQVP